MELFNSLSDINWLSVIVAAIAAFAIGSLWYSPLLVGKLWQKAVGLSDEDMKNANMGLIFGLAFVLNFVAAVLLELFIGPNGTLISGLLTGLIISIGFIATAIGTNYLFERRSLTLYLTDAGYFVIFFAAMGIILGAW